MLKRFAEYIAWLGLGVILTEVMHASDAVELKAPLWAVFGGITGIYAIHLWASQMIQRRGEADAQQRSHYQRIYGWLMGVICLSLLVLIPLLWWGVIKKLAAMGGSGH